MRNTPARIAGTIAAAALGAVPLAALPANAATGGHTKVVANCRTATYEPKKIILTCADANVWVSKVDYTSWTQTSATGSAQYNYNTCTPNCAAGTFKHKQVRIRLGGVVTRDGHRLFTKVVTINAAGHKRHWSPGI